MTYFVSRSKQRCRERICGNKGTKLPWDPQSNLDLYVGSLDPWDFFMAIFNPKLKGTEFQRTPEVSCDRDIRYFGFYGPFSGSCWRYLGLITLLINGVYWGYNPLIPTFYQHFLGHPRRGNTLAYQPGTPRPTIDNRLFQLDDSKSLYRNWLFHHFHPL